MRSIATAFLLLLVVVPVYAEGFSTVILEEGVTDFGPLARTYEGGFNAEISPGRTFVWIDEARNGEDLYYLLERGPSGSSLRAITFRDEGDGLEGELVVPAKGGVEVVTEFRLDRAQKRLEYRSFERVRSDINEGDQLPAIELRGLDGSALQTSSFAGKWVVINWWATWCVPCREEIPQLNELAGDSRYRNVIFVAVSPEDPEIIGRFLDRYPFRYRQATGGEGVAEIFGEHFPRHFVVSPEGVVTADVTGGSSRIGEVLRAALDRALDGSSSRD